MLAKLAAELRQSLSPGASDRAPVPMTSAMFAEHAFGFRPAFQGLIALIVNNPVGYVLYHPGFLIDYAAPSLTVIDLYVSSWSRKNGIATSLMSSVVAEARKMGATVINSSVSKHNPEAKSFYKFVGVEYMSDEVMAVWPMAKWPR